MAFILLIKFKKLNKNIVTKWIHRKMASSNNIKTTEGIVSGKVVHATSFSKKKYFAFQGIPYAQPPVGIFRFRDPQPISPWQGVFAAVEEGPCCPQRHVLFREFVGQEDNCLVLNVYTPQLANDSGKSLPVMVWIHGGGFTFGSGNTDLQDPEYWMERNVVIVTCNYRVGALGFLSLGTDEIPGNAGLKDQVMVLRWVQRNISQFGGDPDNVTLFGESAGAASVHCHLFSPMSRGLFHRAILMSGCSLNSWAFAVNPVQRSLALSQHLGSKDSNTEEVIKFLRSVPVFDVVKMQGKVVTAQDKPDIRVFPFVPCIEPPGKEGERFLTEHPRSLLQRGLVAPVPIIIGSNDKEGKLIMNDVPHTDKYLKILNENFSRIVPKNFGFPQNAPEIIRQFFFGNKPINWDTVNEYLDFFGDVFFYIGLDETIRLHLASGVAPVYCYSFKFEGDLGYLSFFIQQLYPQIKLKGVCHADDLGYIFKYNIPGPPQLEPDTPEYQMIIHMTTLFSNFAKTGDPNGERVIWERSTLANSAWKGYLELDRQIKMRNNRLEKERMEFWDSLRQPQSKL